MRYLLKMTLLSLLVLVFIGIVAPKDARSEAVSPVWQARYKGLKTNDAASDDVPIDLVVDQLGNTYVTVYTWFKSNVDYATVKYDANGVQLWKATYDGPGTSRDYPVGVSVDTTGNVYVTGSSLTSLDHNNFSEYTTVKYDSNGNQLWVARYDRFEDKEDLAVDLEVDGSGNVYVTGFSTGSGNQTDYTTLKYDTDGNQLWIAHYDGPNSYDDVARSLALDAFGNVYVMGSSVGASFEGNIELVKYDTKGNQLWATRFVAWVVYDLLGQALAIDAQGNIYVAGNSALDNDRVNSDYLILKFNASGNQLWTARYDGPEHSYDEVRSLAVDKSGNVYVSGFSIGRTDIRDHVTTTLKYDTEGHKLWETRYARSINIFGFTDNINVMDMALDKNDNVYITGTSAGSENGKDYMTLKYDTEGHEIWGARYSGSAVDFNEAAALAIDSSGNVYVTGYTSDGVDRFDQDFMTLKYPAPPVAPTGLAASAGTNSITLNWNAPPTATYYTVHRGTTTGGPYTTLIGSRITGTSFTDTTAFYPNRYYYVVTAHSPTGASEPSTEVNGIPLIPPPSIVSATPGEGQVTIRFSSVNGATGYNVKRSSTLTGPFTTLNTTPLTGTEAELTYTDTTVTNNTRYYYAVTALNAIGESSLSTVVGVKPPLVDTCLPGDVAGPFGTLNISDAVALLKHLAATPALDDPAALRAADANRDGKVDIADVVKLLRNIVGLDPLPGAGTCVEPAP